MTIPIKFRGPAIHNRAYIQLQSTDMLLVFVDLKVKWVAISMRNTNMVEIVMSDPVRARHYIHTRYTLDLPKGYYIHHSWEARYGLYILVVKEHDLESEVPEIEIQEEAEDA